MHISIDEIIGIIEKHTGRRVGPAPRNFFITGVSSITHSKAGTLTWMNEQAVDWREIQSAVIICSDRLIPPAIDRIFFIPVKNPRLVFAKVLSEILEKDNPRIIHPGAVISEGAEIGDGVSIGCGSFIDENVRVGDRTIVGNNVVIRSGCTIGSDCAIKSNTVIGEKGFGFAFEKDGTPVEIPQVGGVVIENHVEIGALNTVASGTIDPTRIQSHVKIDDHVHVAHNVVIGNNSIITACVELSGGVIIKENVWIGPNVSVKEKVTVGAHALIGIGAVVIRDVAPDAVVAGNPARFLKTRRP